MLLCCRIKFRQSKKDPMIRDNLDLYRFKKQSVATLHRNHTFWYLFVNYGASKLDLVLVNYHFHKGSHQYKKKYWISDRLHTRLEEGRSAGCWSHPHGLFTLNVPNLFLVFLMPQNPLCVHSLFHISFVFQGTSQLSPHICTNFSTRIFLLSRNDFYFLYGFLKKLVTKCFGV